MAYPFGDVATSSTTIRIAPKLSKPVKLKGSPEVKAAETANQKHGGVRPKDVRRKVKRKSKQFLGKFAKTKSKNSGWCANCANAAILLSTTDQFQQRKSEKIEKPGTESPVDISTQRNNSFFENNHSGNFTKHVFVLCKNDDQSLEKLEESDVIVMAKYNDTCPPGIKITYERVCSLNKELVTKQNHFVLVVFHEFDSTSKLFIRVTGFAACATSIDTMSLQKNNHLFLNWTKMVQMFSSIAIVQNH